MYTVFVAQRSPAGKTHFEKRYHLDWPEVIKFIELARTDYWLDVITKVEITKE